MKRLILMNKKEYDLTNKEASAFLFIAQKKGIYYCERLKSTINTSVLSNMDPIPGEEYRKIYIYLNKENGNTNKYIIKNNKFYELEKDGRLYEEQIDPKTGTIPIRILESLYEQDEYYDAPGELLPQSYKDMKLLENTKQKKVC